MLFSPVQINEEAEQVEAEFNHRLLHVGLQLPPVVDLSRVKDPILPNGTFTYLQFKHGYRTSSNACRARLHMVQKCIGLNHSPTHWMEPCLV